MTKKQRAQAYTDKVGILGAYQGYITGATEQEAIDTEIHERALAATVKTLIEKACDILWDVVAPSVNTSYQIEALQEKFRSALEVAVKDSLTTGSGIDFNELTWQDMLRVSNAINHTSRLTKDGLTRESKEFHTEVLSRFLKKRQELNSDKKKMNSEERFAVLQAYFNGKAIQMTEKGLENWNDVDHPIFDFALYDFRIKPEPEKERVPDVEK